MRLCLGSQQTQIGAAMGFGEAHGAGPFAAGEFGQIQLLLRVRAMRMQAFVSTVGEAGIHGPSLVGAVEHFIKALVHHQR